MTKPFIDNLRVPLARFLSRHRLARGHPDSSRAIDDVVGLGHLDTDAVWIGHVQQLDPVDLSGCDAGRLYRGGIVLVVEVVDADTEMVDRAHPLGIGGLNQAEKTIRC